MGQLDYLENVMACDKITRIHMGVNLIGTDVTMTTKRTLFKIRLIDEFYKRHLTLQAHAHQSSKFNFNFNEFFESSLTSGKKVLDLVIDSNI